MAKLALCIGINNYPGTYMDLEGCVNDATDWAQTLISRGFSVTSLLDAQATKAGMVAAFQCVIAEAVDGDVVVITFSGHGTYQRDLDGDEADGIDEALCPYDVHTHDAALIDDEIHAIFRTRRDGVHLVLISDSCHSGTVNRAPPAPAGAAIRPRFMPLANWMSAHHLLSQTAKPPGSDNPVRIGASAFAAPDDVDLGEVLLAGCEEGDNHFSYDAKIAGRANGAFTYHALQVLRTLPPTATYADWHAALTPARLPTADYPQTPQLIGNTAARGRQIFS
jgi:hypothetical protein